MNNLLDEQPNSAVIDNDGRYIEGIDPPFYAEGTLDTEPGLRAAGSIVTMSSEELADHYDTLESYKSDS